MCEGMSRVLVVLVMVAGFLVGVAGPAAACSCAVAKPKELVRGSSAVFTATATGVRVVEPMLDGGEVVATLRVDHVYKGSPGVRTQVRTRAQSAACGYQFAKGTRYLVFARKGKKGLTTGLCSGNRVLPPGDKPLRLSDRTYGMGPLTAELMKALGKPERPRKPRACDGRA